MSAPLDTILGRLERVKKSGGSYSARCPAHDDRDPSLSISEGDDGRVLLKCHATCSTEAIVAALGLELGDLFPPKEGSRERRIVATYNYTAENGEPLFEVVRFEPKDFRQRRPDGSGGWIWNLRDTRRVLYRLPELRAAIEAGTAPIYFVEGEKDAEAVRKAGGIATCNPMGAGKWSPEYVEQLRGAPWVVVIADDDEPGREHARKVAGELRAAGIETHLALPAVGKDTADHLAAGKGLGELRALEDEEPAGDSGESVSHVPSHELEPLDLSTLLAGPPPPVDWLWRGWLARGDLSLIVGDPGVGKSLLSLALAESFRHGRAFLGAECAQARVGIFDFENPLEEAHKRLRAIGVTAEDHAGLVYFHVPSLNLGDEDDHARLAAVIAEHELDVIVIDSLRRAAPGLDENDSRAVSAVLSPLRALSAATGRTIIVLHHPRKRSHDAPSDAGQMVRGSGDLVASVDTLLYLRAKEGGAFTLEHAKSRRGVPHEPILVRIEADDDTLELVSEGTAATADDKVEAMLARVVRSLGDGPLARTELALRVGEQTENRTFQRALSLGKQRDLLATGKDGKRTIYSLTGEVYG